MAIPTQQTVDPVIKQVQIVPSEPMKKQVIPFTGKLITAEDPVFVGKNFRKLVNMRYKEQGIASTPGMTKINTSVMGSPVTRTAHHFRKMQTAEVNPVKSYVLTQSYNAGISASYVLQNTTDIPEQGNFEATPLWTDAAGAERGSFSDAPQGQVAYCNGKESCLWGGEGIPIGRFLNFDSAQTFLYDQTDKLAEADSTNLVTLTADGGGGGKDTNNALLLHLDNNVTDDAVAGAKTVTNVGNNVTFTASIAKFGYSGVFNGSNAYLSTTDHADFDFSDGTWTVDMWARLTGDTTHSLYYQQTAAPADNFHIHTTAGSSYGVAIIVTKTVTSAGTDIIAADNLLISGDLHHIEVSEDGDNWYIFVDGNLVATTSSATRAANYTGDVYIGRGDAVYLAGYLDEYRVSKTCRHTTNFSIPTSAYSSSGAYKAYIQTARPAQGFKFYISHANASAATAGVSVWNGASYASLSISDGTSSSGKALAQNGSITFTSTVGTAKPKYLYGSIAHTYEITFTGIDADTAIYHVTADCPFQLITNIWDGIERSIAKFYRNKTAYEDFTTNVFEDRYNSSDPTTYVELDSMTSGQSIEVGFLERQTALDLVLAPNKPNTTANTVATVYYWNGTAYVTVGLISDGTSVGAISLAAPGVISWDAPAETSEQQKTINNGIPMYFYKVIWSNTLSADVQLSYVAGIPAPKTIKGYKFPIFGQERVLLCNNLAAERNAVLYSADGTAQVFNGSDSGKIYFGDSNELTCGCNVFSQLSQNLYNITLLFKFNEIWGLVRGADGWQKYRVASTIGCNAPKTLKTVVIPPLTEDKSGNRNVAVWMKSSDGVYISDGRHPIMVSHDIRDLFDQNSSRHINQDYGEEASAWIDQSKLEYHLVVALTDGSVTTNDAEFVLDLRRWKWYEVDRGTGKKIQCGVSVTDEFGNNYTYGFIDSGYMERLEYGTTFDGNSIVSNYQFGDFTLVDGDILSETRMRKLIAFMVAKTTTIANSTITHTVDTATSGTAYTADPTLSGRRVTYPVNDANSTVGVFHSFEGTITTTDETKGFEPLALGIFYEYVREHL
jgi:hypothetical protein